MNWTRTIPIDVLPWKGARWWGLALDKELPATRACWKQENLSSPRKSTQVSSPILNDQTWKHTYTFLRKVRTSLGSPGTMHGRTKNCKHLLPHIAPEPHPFEKIGTTFLWGTESPSIFIKLSPPSVFLLVYLGSSSRNIGHRTPGPALPIMYPYSLFTARSRAHPELENCSLASDSNYLQLGGHSFWLYYSLSFACDDKTATGQTEMKACGYVNKVLFTKVDSGPDWLEDYGLLTSHLEAWSEAAAAFGRAVSCIVCHTIRLPLSVGPPSFLALILQTYSASWSLSTMQNVPSSAICLPWGRI